MAHPAPIEEKPAEAGPEASLYRQHGVGIILLHGKAVYLGSLGRVAQGVKIPQNAGGLQSQCLEMPLGRHRRLESIAWGRGAPTALKFGGAENMTGFLINLPTQSRALRA